MQSVIGEYASFAQAQQAVRSLEAHASIQDTLIADTRFGSYRRLAHAPVGRDAVVNFVVLMTGESASIERARELLRLRARSAG